MANIFSSKKHQECFKVSYDETTGISTAEFNNKYGKFVGTAKLNPADEKSNFIGFHIAECRANIAYYQAVVKVMEDRHFILLSALQQEPNSKVLKGMAKDAGNKLAKAYENLNNEKAYLATYMEHKFKKAE